MIVFNTVPQLQNWSGYDYIGFWVYNGSSSEMYARTRRMAVSTYVGTSIRMHPGEWTFVAFDIHKYPVGAWDQEYDLDGVKEYAIEFEKNGNASPIAVNSVFYFSSIRGYNYVNGESGENIVERMDEAVGVGAIADATERIANGGYAFDISLAKVDTGVGERSMTKVEYLLNVNDAQINDNFRVNGGNINVMNGPDETMICGLLEGADGAIGTSYNILPKIAVGIYDNFMRGDIFAAKKYQDKLNSVIDIVFGKNLAYWKAIMSIMGYDMGYTVEPQIIPDEHEYSEMEKRLKEIGLEDLIA